MSRFKTRALLHSNKNARAWGTVYFAYMTSIAPRNLPSLTCPRLDSLSFSNDFSLLQNRLPVALSLAWNNVKNNYPPSNWHRDCRPDSNILGVNFFLLVASSTTWCIYRKLAQAKLPDTRNVKPETRRIVSFIDNLFFLTFFFLLSRLH